ncbi:glycerophosphodiester phosphodiesterase [Geomicrobium sp. JCM 19037]|uniref:glycerophosphodiester phosphodiesterase n=1 Tax=Geomicrobium sp. JCM 19037 TaxID=1460634 RepID=UPI0005A9129B|nr:glycerophosphodiester phosphodiesterase [Geomicrobium sp. JCM 19037]
MKGKCPIVIAHRGASEGTIKENTLLAFERAIVVGADYIETDIQMTADGHLVCFHDRVFKGKKIRHLTYSALRKLAKEEGFDVPTLEDTVVLCKGRIRLNLELKETKMEHEVVNVLATHGVMESTLVSSFQLSVLKKVRLASARVTTGLIVGSKRHWLRDRRRIKKLQTVDVDVVCSHYRYVKKLHHLNVPLYIWTVNQKKTIRQMLDLNVDGLITDDVVLAKNIIQDQQYFKK